MADTPAVNQPASGTYGEQASLDRLKQALPAGAVGQPPPPGDQAAPPMPSEPVRPLKQVEGRPNTGAAAPPGLPSVLMAPTNRPHVPVSTPLAPGSSPAGPQSPQQSRLALLDMLANSPDVSETTREWAQTVIDAILGT